MASRRRSVWNPRSVVSTCIRLLTSSPAPTSSISDNRHFGAHEQAARSILASIADGAALALAHRGHDLTDRRVIAGTRPVQTPTTKRHASGKHDDPAVQRDVVQPRDAAGVERS